MCEIPIFDHMKITTIYLTSLHKHVLTFFLNNSWAPNMYNLLSCRPENRPTVIGPYFTDDSSTADSSLTTGLAALLVRREEAFCSSSHQCGLLVITTRLSLQQTAHSLDFHLRDNTINQIRTSSSCSHIYFHSSGTRAVILFLNPSLTNLIWPNCQGVSES